MDRDLERTWHAVQEAIRLVVSEGSFNTWIRQAQLNSTKETGGRLVCEISCPNIMIKNTLEQRYRGQISQELTRILEKECEVVFVIKSRRAGEQESIRKDLPLFEERKADDQVWKRARLRGDFTFENYAVSGSNQMAYAAATAVAKKPGEAYNPLFVYGGVGVGKTHLMQGIGHELIRRGEGAVLFCSGEEFTNDLVEGIRNKSTEKVRAKYRKVKLLLIDDVQFIAGKASVQEEFFHTFNAIQREGGQIVMTSDKPPGEITKLEERLKSRFGAGLIVDVGPADFELRTAILLIKAKQKEIELPMDIAQTIASSVEGIRELEGFLVRLTTEVQIKGESLTVEMTERLLNINRPLSGPGRIVTPTEVMGVVGNYYGVGVQLLKGDRRTKHIVWPRQILMYLLRHELRLSFGEVGRLVGGRDHTTVIHAADKVTGEMAVNEKLRMEIAELKKKLLIT